MKLSTLGTIVLCLGIALCTHHRALGRSAIHYVAPSIASYERSHRTTPSILMIATAPRQVSTRVVVWEIRRELHPTGDARALRLKSLQLAPLMTACRGAFRPSAS